MRPVLAIAALFGAIAACLPSYTFSNGSADAGPDVAVGDSSMATDSSMGESGAMDSSGADSPEPDSGPGITLDVGFPLTAEINDATGTMLSKTLAVPGGGRMLVAVVVWGQHGGMGVWPVTFASPDLNWANPVQAVSVGPSYPQAVGVGIWTAWAASALPSEKVTATSSSNVTADAVIVIYSLAGASQTVGAIGNSNGFSTAQAPLSVTVDAQAAGSFIIGGVLDGDGAPGVRGNTLAGTIYDFTLGSGSGDGIAVGRSSTVTAGPGNVTIGQDQSFPYDVAAGIEILRQ